MQYESYLPTSQAELEERGWWWYDFLLVTGDAYVDHPSFGAAVIGRLLEADGFRVAVLAQPDWHSADAFRAMGRPKLGVLIGAGNLDSMVAHYTAAKKRRSEDFYSPGKQAGRRPDRACIVYANRAREAFGQEVPIILGGLEASLRRFAHYDYWDDAVRRSILIDSGADLLIYGMAERAEREVCRRLKKKRHIGEMSDIRGICYLTRTPEQDCGFPYIQLPDFSAVQSSKRDYADAARIQYEEHDPVRGKALWQWHGDRCLVCNPPAMPLNTAELDAVAALPFTREPHPMYDSVGGVPAIEEVRFSVIHNRGCFGACNFCALALHQGRMVTSRSHESVIAEVERMTHHPLWKGYVSDVGGPTANFRRNSCKEQAKHGMCPKKRCLAPTACRNLDADHSDYLRLLRRLRELPGVKKVFIRSGIRFDFMLQDKNGEFFAELVHHHISGQLKVAPEHCINSVLDFMGKPHIQVYEQFMEKYRKLNQRYAKEQFLVPYLMSSHPGCTLQDAVDLAVYLNRLGRQPEQVQDFYPTPGTLSTCMYYTELDPRTMEPVYVAKTPREKALQRALLQWKRPDRRQMVIEALREAGRTDLIGFGRDCLVRPDGSTGGYRGKNPKPPGQRKAAQKPEAPRKPEKSAARKKTGWAKAKPKAKAGGKKGKRP